MRVLIGMVLWVSCVVFMPGCGGASEAEAAEAAQDRELSFVVRNQSGKDIRDIGLEGANFPMSFSPIEDDGTARIRSKKLELPETLTLHWSDQRGERHEGSVRVWSELGGSYSGPVVLTINYRNQVSVTGG